MCEGTLLSGTKLNHLYFRRSSCGCCLGSAELQPSKGRRQNNCALLQESSCIQAAISGKCSRIVVQRSTPSFTRACGCEGCYGEFDHVKVGIQGRGSARFRIPVISITATQP